MGLPVQTIIFVLLAAASTLAADEANSVEQDHSNGFGYEIIQTKLEMLEFRFSELFVQLKEQGETFLNNQRRVEDEQRHLNQIVDRYERKISNLIVDLEDSVGINVSRISDQSRQILELQTICSNHDSIRSQLFEMHPKNTSARSEQLASVKLTDPEACAENSDQMSGLCRMQIGSEDVMVYREQVRFGGNWIVVLQQMVRRHSIEAGLSIAMGSER
ncbi:uncharacterized protein LOC135702668 [Ochlerotatus camptorhynchus]|uniref:uncharacterized protein LOC135702668 n=1 Tax=Ochlerotatus camptorhynchus TaxID=644619 RepID=UPI0031D58650